MYQPDLLTNTDKPTRQEEAAITVPSRVTRLQDKCSVCNKVAKELMSTTVENDNGDEVKTIILECYHTLVKIIPKATPFHEFVTAVHRNNGCAHEWDKNHCIKCDAYKLFDFQVTGARFIETAIASGTGAGLFDEMGLGKTVQPLAYLHYHPERFPVLFVVKSGVKFQFFKEIIRFLGIEYFAQVISTSKDPVIPGLKTYIIGYDLLRRFDREKLVAAGIKTIILDECQQIKNPDSSRTQEVRRLVTDTGAAIIPLSGTPWKNRGSEFFTVLNMLAPAKFPSYQGFLDRWVDYYFSGEKTKEGGIRNPKKFKEYISEIAIRRERKEVTKELPLISRNMHYTQLEGAEAIMYDEEVSDFVRFYNDEILGGDGDSMATQTNMLARMARMRHITGLAKIPTTVEFVVNHVNETGRKIVIFVHHKDVGELMFRKFKEELPNILVMKMTAELTSEKRFETQEKFNETETCIMIASTLAAGEGLNLQSCCDCVLHERQWNPANEEQAEGRFIRIGQTADTVTGTYTTAEGTIDDHLASLVEQKRANFHAAMNSGDAPTWNQGDLMKELASRIVKDATKLQKAASW